MRFITPGSNSQGFKPSFRRERPRVIHPPFLTVLPDLIRHLMGPRMPLQRIPDQVRNDKRMAILRLTAHGRDAKQPLCVGA